MAAKRYGWWSSCRPMSWSWTWRCPELNGIDAAAQMTRRSKQLGVIMLTMYPDEEYLIRAVTAGVRGYLLKESAEPDLIRAVKGVSWPYLLQCRDCEHVDRRLRCAATTE